jgi:hypothetical protein
MQPAIFLSIIVEFMEVNLSLKEKSLWTQHEINSEIRDNTVRKTVQRCGYIAVTERVENPTRPDFFQRKGLFVLLCMHMGFLKGNLL